MDGPSRVVPTTHTIPTGEGRTMADESAKKPATRTRKSSPASSKKSTAASTTPGSENSPKPSQPGTGPDLLAKATAAGEYAAKRGIPDRRCPHTEKGEPELRAAWMKGYHDYAHPHSTQAVKDIKGGYRGSY